MISTVTTTTVTTVTSIALIASFAFMAVVVLLVLLVQKEIVAVSDNPQLVAWGRVLNMAIVPLLLSFFFIAIVTVAEVLR